MQTVEHNQISFNELLRAPGVTEELELRSTFGFLALHGGNLERTTDAIAREAAQRCGGSLYALIQPKGMRHHISSTKMDPAESTNLTSFLEHCDVVVSVHGYGILGRWTELLIGGRNRDLAGHLGASVRDQLPQYRVVDDIETIPRRLRGQHPKNPCNLSRGGGVQIELPPRVRGLTPLVGHWPGHVPGDRFPHLESLITALAGAADSWQNSTV